MEGRRIELLIPRLADQALLNGASPKAGSILLVESNELILVELHNFFEAAGFNLIEAADVDEAVALGEMHEGRLDLVIAGARQAGEVLRHLSGPHPWLKALCILEAPGVGNLPPDQIGRPFTERELLDKVERLLNGTEAAPAAAGVLTS